VASLSSTPSSIVSTESSLIGDESWSDWTYNSLDNSLDSIDRYPYPRLASIHWNVINKVWY
jgi:hypothetical protein